MNKERLDSDIFNTINYSNQNRSIFPKRENERNFGQYYIIENCPNKSILNKSLIVKEELNNENYYENYTNPINFTQYNPNYLDYNSFCPPKFYENRISPSNKYLYTDVNKIYNYIPNIAQKFDNNRFYMKNNNKDSINAIQKENNRHANKQKAKLDKYQNGIKLNISTLETQYPSTFINTDFFNKRKNFIQSNIIKNITNSKNHDESRSLTFKNNKNKKNMNIYQIKPLINIAERLEKISSKKNNNNKDQNSNDNHIYHRKNKSHLQSSNNAQKGKYNGIHNNNKNDGINFSNHNQNIKKSPKEKVKDSCYDNERNKYSENYYNKCPKYVGIKNKIQRIGSKNKSTDKKLLKYNQIQGKIKKRINNLEQIFASFI
jgi:hypothetical protein